MTDEAETLADIRARHATRKASWQNYGALHPLDDGPVIDDTDALLAIVKRYQEREAALREALEFYRCRDEEGWCPSFDLPSGKRGPCADNRCGRTANATLMETAR